MTHVCWWVLIWYVDSILLQVKAWDLSKSGLASVIRKTAFGSSAEMLVSQTQVDMSLGVSTENAIRKYINTYVHTNKHANIRTHMHACIHTYILIHTDRMIEWIGFKMILIIYYLSMYYSISMNVCLFMCQ